MQDVDYLLSGYGCFGVEGGQKEIAGDDDAAEEGDEGREGMNVERLPKMICPPLADVVASAATDVSRPSMSATIRCSDPREIHPRCRMHRIKRERRNSKNGIMTT